MDGWISSPPTVTSRTRSSRFSPTSVTVSPPQLFWNARGRDSRAGFVPVPVEKSGQDLFQPIVGRGSAFADIDGDGDLDVVIAQINGPPMLSRNDLAPRPNWLRIRLVGTKSNRDAIGAWVKLRARRADLVAPGDAHSRVPVTIRVAIDFRVRQGDAVDELTVQWPDGTVSGSTPPALNRVVTITEPQGATGGGKDNEVTR